MADSHVPLLRVTGLFKSYATPVLQGIDLTVGAGELVAVTGENGAGKSTLSRIIAGLTPADAGEMQLDGAHYRPRDRSNAEASGVRMVLQELGLIGTLSIAENLALGSLPAIAGFIRVNALHARAQEHLARVGLQHLDPGQPVSALGIGQQQLLEIARALSGPLRVLILDEPTAMLTAPEVERLFGQIEQLKQQGIGIIYISHRLDEIHRIAERIVVLRDGHLVLDRPARALSHDEIVGAMIGHDYLTAADHERRVAADELLRIERFTRGTQVRDVNLQLHAGEIVGLAGLVGSGRTELLRLIFGADRRDQGELYLDRATLPTRIDSPSAAVAHGIGLLTEDRKSQGLIMGQSLEVNVSLAHLSSVSRHGLIDSPREQATYRHWASELNIRARDGRQRVDELSGGNQQKILLARWLHRQCRILLLDEPTRGIDVGARADIYRELERLAAEGKALLVVSSDLRELMTLCDRIAVMSAGRLVQTFERGSWNEELLLTAAFSGYGSEGRRA